MQRKCACGGSPGPTGACAACHRKRELGQTKLTVNRPGDRYEQEADRVAEQVMRMPDAPRTAPQQQRIEEEAGPALLQTSAEAPGAAHAGDAAPPVVHEVLRDAGRPLDAATRLFMEARFGHDFSRVRVHTDARAAASARTVHALAYTVGQDVVFGAGYYQPHSLPGRALIAHELAHTIQQGEVPAGSGQEDAGLEREANHAALRVLGNRSPRVGPAATPPAIQFLKVTGGGFGRALEEFTNLWSVPDRTVRLLQTSGTFMRLARTLDQHYVAREDSYRFNPEHGPNGRINAGAPDMPRSMIGKRELMVIKDAPAFLPFEAPDNPLSADLIQVNQLDAPGFIQELGHEVTHAANFVGASAPPPQSLVDEINAGIREEISTRQSEATILSEVRDPQVRQQVAQVGTRVPAEVERDIPPAFGLTYLEIFFFERRLRDAQAADGITDERAREIREVISMAVRNGLAVPDWYGEYGRVWLDRQTAHREWEAFHRTHRPGDPDYLTEKEQLLQDHARRFFGGRVTYRTLPAPAAVPATP